MDQIAIVLLQMLRWITVLTMLGAVLLGFGMALMTLLRWKTSLLANILFAFLLGALSFTVFHNLLGYMQVTLNDLRWHFLPIYFSYALGPLLFFSTKARLYPNTRLRWTDSKHFILPVVQFVVFLTIGFRSVDFKASIFEDYNFWTYGAVEDFIFLVGTVLYWVFAYRFVRHAWSQLKQHPDRHWAFVLGWQRRMLKVLAILFALHASYVMSTFLAWKLFEINLHDKALFSSFGELSLAGMLIWLSINAWFARQRKI